LLAITHSYFSRIERPVGTQALIAEYYILLKRNIILSSWVDCKSLKTRSNCGVV